jgi:hypothetical protein
VAISSRSDLFPTSFDLAYAFLHLDSCLDNPSSHIHGWLTSSPCIVFLLSCKQHYQRSLGYHSASLGRIGTIEHAFFSYSFLTFPVPHSTTPILSPPVFHSFHPLSYFPHKNYCMGTSFALLRKGGGLHCTHYFSPSSFALATTDLLACLLGKTDWRLPAILCLALMDGWTALWRMDHFITFRLQATELHLLCLLRIGDFVTMRYLDG